MNKIDEINQRLSNLAAGKIVKYDNAMNLATQYALDYKNDVEYLLDLIKENANEWAGFVEKEARIHLDSIKQLQQENERLTEGWKVIENLPMGEHPSDIRNFGKRMLKGETPYKL
jgi:hypothetical protein